MSKFNVGDLVSAKISPYQPIMKIIEVNASGTYKCRFNNSVKKEVIIDCAESSLQKYTPPPIRMMRLFNKH
jgi:uncharacterized protein YodC (DUF2158 family)